MTAVAACRSCRTEPLENARFCHGCGAPVAASDPDAEYKQVTVLFADVVHSMQIAAAGWCVTSGASGGTCIGLR